MSARYVRPRAADLLAWSAARITELRAIPWAERTEEDQAELRALLRDRRELVR